MPTVLVSVGNKVDNLPDLMTNPIRVAALSNAKQEIHTTLVVSRWENTV